MCLLYLTSLCFPVWEKGDIRFLRRKQHGAVKANKWSLALVKAMRILKEQRLLWRGKRQSPCAQKEPSVYHWLSAPYFFLAMSQGVPVGIRSLQSP